MTKHSLLSLTLLAPLAFVAGCSDVNRADKARAEAASLTANPSFKTYEHNLPPKRLLEVAQRVVSSPPWSLSAEPGTKGTLLTGWKEYRGAFHVARYWQERTRFQVIVAPDFDDPTGKSTLRVLQETQTRATSQADWFQLLDEDRSDRAAELAQAIDAAARSESR